MFHRGPIFRENADHFDILASLRSLTAMTAEKFSVHDFTQRTVNNGIYGDVPLPGAARGLRKLFVVSAKPIKNGDTILSEDADSGKVRTSIAFDVDRMGGGMYRFRAAPHIPAWSVGHAVPESV